MSKRIIKIVLTGGPAAGKTTLTSQILKEFKQEDGWRVITIPETATELISGFGIKPFGNCMSMLAFQDFVIADQIHKEKLALDAAQVVPEENIQMIENEETSGIDPKLVLGAAVIAGAAIVGGIKHLKSKKNKPADDKPKTKKKIHLRAPWTITEETVPEKTEDADKEVVEEPSDEEE